MSTRIAINGFGRIGRLFFRALLERNFFDGKVEVVAINDIVPTKTLAYLLQYDSVHGKMNVDVKAEGNLLKVGDREIQVLSQKAHPRELPWDEHNIDIVVESTGIFSKSADAKGHVEAGASKVLISAPSDEGVPTFVIGSNDDKYAGEQIVSNASCTTNCLTPLITVLLREGIGIAEGLMTTSHSYTSTQSLVDAPNKKDPRRGRAAAENIIPTSTGAAQAVTQVYPELEGKLTGMAFRVPTPNVSVVDFTFKPERDTSLQEINGLMRAASESYLKTILGYTEDPVVSSDFIHDPRSSIYDAGASIELNTRFFKLVAWYDNEWGYSNRLVDMIGRMDT